MGLKSFFSKQAANPSGFFGRYIMSVIFERGNSNLNNVLMGQIAVQPKDHILEIGFGTGKLISEMAVMVEDGLIEGADISETMFKVAGKKNRVHIRQGKVILHPGDLFAGKFKNGSFDKICTSNSIYFWAEPQKTCKEALSLLKPGGKLFIAFYDKIHFEKLKISTKIFSVYSFEDLKKMLRESGFKKDIFCVSGQDKGAPFHCVSAEK